jgi:hypothetical protein
MRESSQGVRGIGLARALRMTTTPFACSRARRSSHRASLLLVGAAGLLACGGATAPAPPHDAPPAPGDDAQACIKPPQIVHPPHVDTTAGAQKVVQAIQGLIAAGSPCSGIDCPDPNASSYTVTNVVCTQPTQLESDSCAMTLTLPSGNNAAVFTTSPTPTINLIAALEAAGAKVCNGMFVRLRNLSASATHVAFEDDSIYSSPTAPNVSVHGAEARSLLDAFTAAGLENCDTARDLSLSCARAPDGAASCSTKWTPLEHVGDSDLVASCEPKDPSPGPSLDASQAEAIWAAIAKAAAGAGYKPVLGTIAESTSLSAQAFTWDGNAVAFWLNMSAPAGGGGT